MQNKPSAQFGAQRIDFDVDGGRAFLIRPPGHTRGGADPWLWYAPTFIGTLPNDTHEWIMTRLLAAGLSIAGVDVGESYGNPRGRRTYQALYETLTRDFDLDPKACLLPQSRGGLMLYNWAVEHPGAVRCVGGIYTVCDLSSWPGLDIAAPAYGFSPNELAEQLPAHNPIDRLAALVAHGVPVLHVHGDRDVPVPLERNSGELVRRYRALGGDAELRVIAGKGHEEVAEFFECERLVDFFVAHARSAAGV